MAEAEAERAQVAGESWATPRCRPSPVPTACRSRTPEQVTERVAERVRRRGWSYGYAYATRPGGKGIAAPAPAPASASGGDHLPVVSAVWDAPDMSYPTTYPDAAADQHATDLAGQPCPRLTGPLELARRLAELDERYIRAQFVVLDELSAARDGGAPAVRKLIADRRLPQPAYRLDDGTDMVAEDFFAPLDAAGGVEALPEWFRDRYRRAAHRLGLSDDPAEADLQWTEYLTGGYAVCLKQATPESIAEKALHITTIERLLGDPRPNDASWAGRLRAAVDALAAIERPGALLDPPRWGGPMSPQWYGAYLRAYFPQAFTSPTSAP
jgi:Family of unknown function (DUF6058)